MNKTLALIAALGLVASPVFAAEAAKDAKAEKVVAGEAKAEAKEAAKEAKEAAKEAKDAAKDAKEAAPAAGEAKKEEKKM